MKLLIIFLWLFCGLLFFFGYFLGFVMGESRAYEECARRLEESNKKAQEKEDDGK